MHSGTSAGTCIMRPTSAGTSGLGWVLAGCWGVVGWRGAGGSQRRGAGVQGLGVRSGLRLEGSFVWSRVVLLGRPEARRVSGFRGFGVSGFQGFRVSGFQGFRVSGFQGFRVSGFRGFRVVLLGMFLGIRVSELYKPSSSLPSLPTKGRVS